MSRGLRRALVVGVVVLGLGASGLVCGRVAERGRYATEFSSLGAGAEGSRAAFLLAESLGARPARWTTDLGRLPEGGMLLALGSCQQLSRRPLSRPEREYLITWIEGGGTLVVAGVPDYLPSEALGLRLEALRDRCRPSGGLIGLLLDAEDRAREAEESGDPEPTAEELIRALREEPLEDEEANAPPPAEMAWPEPDSPFAGLMGVGLRNPLPIRIEDAEAPYEVWLRIEDRPAAVRRSHGAGQVILFASGSVFQNRDLDAQAGGLVLARLIEAHAPSGPILFDEFHLGLGAPRSTIRYLRQLGLGALIVQLLVVLVFVLWRLGARLGQPTAAAPAPAAGTASYVEGVGALFEGSADVRAASQILKRRALERVAAHHHLPSPAPARLAADLEARGLNEAARAVRALDGLDLDRRRLTPIVKEIDGLTAEATRGV